MSSPQRKTQEYFSFGFFVCFQFNEKYYACIPWIFVLVRIFRKKKRFESAAIEEDEEKASGSDQTTVEFL